MSDNLDLGAGLGQSLGDGISAVVIGRDDDALANENRVSA